MSQRPRRYFDVRLTPAMADGLVAAFVALEANADDNDAADMKRTLRNADAAIGRIIAARNGRADT